MAELTARRDSLLDYLPGNWQQAINTNPLLNALGRAMNRKTPDLGEAAMREYGTPEQQEKADQDWLMQKMRGPKLNPLAAEMLDKGGMLANFLGPGVKLPPMAPKPTGIRAYHGSPHDFDRFDMSKIGTGEGAQAYGRGLYFAENEGVARDYRNRLAAAAAPGTDRGGPASAIPRNVGERINLEGRPAVERRLAELDAADQAELAQLAMAQPDPSTLTFATPAERARAEMAFALHNSGARRSIMEDSTKRGMRAFERQALQEMLKTGQFEWKPPGRMYEVNIKADPEQFLDWDLPLSQQPEGVKRTIEPALKAAALDLGKGASPEKIARFEAMGLKNVADRLRPKEIDPWSLETVTLAQQYPNALRDAGIPGIKYLDQQSRTAGQGSRNYVVFDDKLIDILRKYGLLPPVAAGTAAALNEQEPQQ